MNLLFACGLFIGIDIVTGIVKGIATKTLSSLIMKEGLWKKLGTIILALVAYCVTLIVTNTPELTIACNGVYNGIGVYIVTMELLSIIENICEINPDLKLTSILEIFKMKK